jgi:hypothetical protein
MVLVSQEIREAADRVADSLAAIENARAGAEAVASVAASSGPASFVSTLLVSSSLSLPAVVSELDDAGLQALLVDAAAARARLDAVIAVGAGVVAKRSQRELGYDGLAARNGQRSAIRLVRSLIGSSTAEAGRQVRLGEAMGEADAARRLREDAAATAPIGLPTADGSDGAPDEDVPIVDLPVAASAATVPVELPWYEPITRAVAEHRLSPEGASALLRGLGEPDDRCGTDVLSEAAEELVADATGVHADELVKRARWLRDRLDPVGISERARAHFDARKARLGTNASGARTLWLEADDDSGAWLESIIGAGMRPRRGGPRFVDATEAQNAEKLRMDPRTDEQLVFDLLMDTLRAGALADPATVYGSRQPGVRVVITKEELDKRDSNGNLTGTGFLEDTGQTVPPETIERLLCETGTREVLVDADGCPLDVGREQRLFTAKQRVAMAIRDGGCMDEDCDRPPSYTEAHHINHWAEHHGKTDIADGILLCRYHHMLLHNQHWRIRREGSVYWLCPPPGDSRQPVQLHRKGAWWKTTGVTPAVHVG